jgi:hypothetical protein
MTQVPTVIGVIVVCVGAVWSPKTAWLLLIGWGAFLFLQLFDTRRIYGNPTLLL